MIVVSHLNKTSPGDRFTPHKMGAEYLSTIAEPGSAAASHADGVFAFYSQIPIYNLTGLANNRDYKVVGEQGRYSEYFAEKNIKYLVTGEVGFSGVYGTVTGSVIKDSCTDPLYDDNGRVMIFPIANCRLDLFNDK